MNEMYLLLAVVTVLSSVLIPTIYLRIKEKQFFEELEGRFVECEINGYKTMDSTERQVLKEDYEFLRKRYMKILMPVIVFSLVATIIPILSDLIRIPGWVFYIYIVIIVITFISIEIYIISVIIEIFSKKFRKFKKEFFYKYIYKYIDEEILDMLIEGIIGLVIGGIIASFFIAAIIGAICLTDAETVLPIFNVMLMITNMRVVVYISKKVHKYIEQLIVDEAGLS